MLEDTDDEIWKEIDGFEGQYAISDKGRVKNLKTNRILGGGYDSAGYHFVYLKGKHHSIHRLVALAFIPNPSNLPQINHKNENRKDNDISNLEWCSASYNTRHSIYKQCCKVKQLTKDGKLIKVWDSFYQIGRELGYDIGTIINVCKGRQNYSHGFRWQYENLDSQRVNNRKVIAYKGSEQIGEFASAVKAAEALGLKRRSVYHCLEGRLATLKGFTFRYAD